MENLLGQNYGRFSRRIEIDSNGETAKDKKYAITTANINSIAAAFPQDADITYASESDAVAERNGSLADVKTVMAGFNYIDFSGLQIIKGNFFSANSCKYGQNVAVISERLAQKLFSSFEIIGEEFGLSGRKYKVAGIYKSRSSIASFLGSDGMERVYIPYESLNMPSGIEIETVMIRDDSLGEQKFRVEYIKSILAQFGGIDTSCYKVNDFYNTNGMLSQFESLTVFAAGLWLIWCIAVYLARYLKRNYLGFKDSAGTKYFTEVLITNKLSVVKVAAFSALMVLIMIVVWKSSCFRFYIPAEYIPPDNVFDIGFYAARAGDSIAAHNASAGYKPSQYETDFNNVLKVNVLLAICLLAVFLMMVSGIKLLKLTDSPLLTALTALAISVPIAAAVTCALIPVLGTGLVIPVKELLIFTGFMLMYILKDTPTTASRSGTSSNAQA